MGEQITQALATRNGDASAIDTIHAEAGFALSFGEMRARVEGLNQFFHGVMQEGTDYGKIPGTDKPTLLQPGAQLLDGIFGLAPTFEELATSIRDYERGFFSIDVRCRLVEKRTGQGVAEGIGQCNSKEDRYRWRASKRSCPECGAEAIMRSKYDDKGWYCFGKKGGCGAKFGAADPRIVGQSEGRVENDDTFSLVNTILKMAQKRAHVAATLNATGAGRIFTQDVEDLPEFQRRSADPNVVEGEFTEKPGPAAAPVAGGRPPTPQGSAAPAADGAGARGQQPQAENAGRIQAAAAEARRQADDAHQAATTNPQPRQNGPTIREPAAPQPQADPDDLDGEFERLQSASTGRTDPAWKQYQAIRAAAIEAGLTTVEMRQDATDSVLKDEIGKLQRAMRARSGVAR